MESVYWLIAFVALAGIEAATMALTTVWFAGGAIAAFLMSLAHASVNAQLTVFAVVSFALLIFTRPWAVKHVNRRAVKTNADSLVGKQARVTSEINNSLQTGSAVVNGQEWTARANKDGEIYPADTLVEIRAIQGVKLIVQKAQEETGGR
ncbi:MAG: NfeD family protein [Hungatella sp.]|jgi:membrane protein implicated in regulation of membrane protease activity|nr:NfeD family protein [Hungatella sp.]MCI9502042.1 NfeD family protein [Hungatella sp.]MCI9635366.1 NfeD family protein [Hungatella sp.]